MQYYEKKYPELSKWRYQMIYLAMHTIMTSSNGNIFRVTGYLCGEFTGHRWIPRTKASDVELWCFLVIWDAIVHIMTSL